MLTFITITQGRGLGIPRKRKVLAVEHRDVEGSGAACPFSLRLRRGQDAESGFRGGVSSSSTVLAPTSTLVLIGGDFMQSGGGIQNLDGHGEVRGGTTAQS